MTICYFGDFDPEYARNRVIIKGLRENGQEIILCRTQKKGFFKKFSDLKRQLRRQKYDFIIVGYSDSRAMVPFARLLSDKKIVWDAFYSLYDSWVWDRKLVSPHSLKAVYYWLADWFSGLLADRMLLDTNAQIEYFSKTFILNKLKFIRVFIGTDDSVFRTGQDKTREGEFLVNFHGNFIPLQGVQYIIEAAHILKNEPIKFRLIGDGQTHDEAVSKARGLSNVEFLEKVPFNEMPRYISEADVSLGIFGDTDKASRVIPNKVYEAIALGKAVISGESPAIRELFTDRKDILLCQMANGPDLARKIMEIKNNNELCHNIAAGGRDLFKREATPAIIGKRLMSDLTYER